MSNNQLDALEKTVKDLVELMVLLQNQISGHTEMNNMLDKLTNEQLIRIIQWTLNDI